jgi:SAM-dependent methyltransferase
MGALTAVNRPQGIRLLSGSACPQCGSRDNEVVFRLPAVPVVVNTAWKSADSARSAARMPIDLVSCAACEMLYNASFDNNKVVYTAKYGNALHYSEAFRSFSEELAQSLAERYALRGKLAVEIGCGDGYFLDLLCRTARCRGVGMDPSSVRSNRQQSLSPDVSILREYFEAQECVGEARLVACRQVLEHFQEPMPFLKKLRHAMDPRKKAIVFFEVPNAQFMVEHNRFWDVIYEHCLYLTPHTLRSMFVRAGFEPVATETTFGEQYIALEARPVGPRYVHAVEPADPDLWRSKLERFATYYLTTIRRWREFLERGRETQSRIVIWGASAKTIMFLNLLQCEVADVPYVIDISPAKHGNYISGTGQEIVSPAILESYQPQYVLLMNDNYREEVAQMLTRFPNTKLVSV